jgi:2'-5' RNA ligase
MAGNPLEEKVFRAFLALQLAGAFLKEIRSLTAEMQQKVQGVKWVMPEQVHVTLHFFGNITSEHIKTIRELTGSITGKYGPFHLALGGIGFFPNPDKPRIIWIDLSGDIEIFKRYQEELEKELGQAGFPLEERPFRPHATLGRIKEKGRWDKKQFILDSENLLCIKTEPRAFDKILLFKSTISSEGPHYEALETFYLSSKPGS